MIQKINVDLFNLIEDKDNLEYRIKREYILMNI